MALAMATSGAVLLAAADASALARPLRRCERTIARGLGRCIYKVSRRLNACYRDTGAPCDDAELERELSRLTRRVTAGCAAADLPQLGYGLQSTVQSLVDRLHEDCRGESAALAARTFGGPHGAALAAAPDAAACLVAAAGSAARMMWKAFGAQSNCVRRVHRGATCQTDRVEAEVEAQRLAALAAIDAACPDLRSLTGIDSATYGARALAQTRCMLATAHADPTPLMLDCGPRSDVPVPPRGQWVQVVLDESVWGTRCGDGSPYAFWLRLAPQGSPIEHVLIDLQGGGVCTSESECLGVSSGLFKATDNYQPNGPSGGYRSTDPAVNPFWDWTMMALSYCTQDVYAGGGRTSVFPGITVHRFGAPNTQAALRYLRDVLWQALDAETAAGYRPDLLRVLFGGLSAGGFGVTYNYHYLLDDLRWVNTTAVPDSALGLNNGSLQGVAGLGLLITGSNAWGGLPFQPPYCLASICAVVPYRHTLTAPRLKRAPFQQILTVSNQVDNTQRSTTFFSSSAAWTNAARQAYCATRGRTGLHYFLPAGATSLHGMLQSDARFTAISSNGVTVRDWLAAAMADPDGVVDQVGEGTLASTPGVDPFPCPLD
jgi:Pectinacetylesterase